MRTPIAVWLRSTRKEIGWSQIELAKRLGVSQSQVSQWENDRLLPTAAQRAELLRNFVIGWRQVRGWSQERLGRELSVSQPLISQWERDLAGPSVDQLERIAALLDAPTLGGPPVTPHWGFLPTAVPPPAAAPGPSAAARMVGREGEMAVASQSLGAALAGSCQLLVVAGEAGIGKTRLLEEIAEMAERQGVRVLRGGFSDCEETFPYEGFCELIQHFLRSTPPAMRVREVSRLAEIGSDLMALFPALSESKVLRGAIDVERPAVATTERLGTTLPVYDPHDRSETFELLASAVARMADGGPLALLLERLHAATVSVEALAYLLRRLGPLPILIVATVRPDEIGRDHPLQELRLGLGDDPRLAYLDLRALEGQAFEGLLDLLLPGGEPRPELIERIFDTTEGNPLFVKELVASLLESGDLERDANAAWTLSDAVVSLDHVLPRTIQQAIEARIERLPKPFLQVLEMAAVVGRSFKLNDLEPLVSEPLVLEDAIDHLLAYGLVRERRPRRSAALSFSSAAVREVIYRRLSRRTRRRAHRLYAQHLEARYRPEETKLLAQLVHHFDHAELPAQTVRFARRLARVALDTHSPAKAIGAAATALELIDADEVEDDGALEGELLEIMARAYWIDGQAVRALRYSERAARWLAARGAGRDEVRLACLAAEIAWRLRRIDRARRWVEHGIDLVEAADAETADRVLELGTTLANLRGDYPAARAYAASARRQRPVRIEHGEEGWLPDARLTTVLLHAMTTIDPVQIATDEETEVAAAIFETLIGSDEDGNLVPGLCREWHPDEAGCRFRLLLEPAVRFSDGRPLTAAAVKASLERAWLARVDLHTSASTRIEGWQAVQRGEADHLRGIEVLADHELAIRLAAPLPIFPAMLADIRTAIVATCSGEMPPLVGTGPFMLDRFDQQRVELVRNPGYHRAPMPWLERVTFRIGMRASAIAESFRSGELDIARDLLPEDLESLLRDPRYRSGLVEATRRGVYFVLLNTAGPHTASVKLRQSLLAGISPRDLVWRSLGRFAQPATGLLPPGVLGHDPGRRRQAASIRQARRWLAEAGIQRPVRLRAAVHPIFQDRYRALRDALFSDWSEIGFEVEIVSETLPDLLSHYRRNGDIDLLLGRWNGDYEDPDALARIFHSVDGAFAAYYASEEIDRVLDQARQGSKRAQREALYHRFERLLERDGAVLPLFHEVDCRLADPRIANLHLRSGYPTIDYARLGKRPLEAPPRPEGAAEPRRGEPRGEIIVATTRPLPTLDPLGGGLAQQEIVANVFEPLLRVDDQAHIRPCLASSYETLEHGRHYRFHLRPGVRFHDGRPCTARDVRFTFERALEKGRRSPPGAAAVVRGADAMLTGDAVYLAGFIIRSPLSFDLELASPAARFPVMLTDPRLAVVPEQAETFAGTWRQGCVGTGAFRVVHFQPDRRIALERNPLYWRPGVPACDRLTFRVHQRQADVLAAFEKGHLSLASGLSAPETSRLRRQPLLAAGYREAPRLSTCFLMIRAHRGQLADTTVRQQLVTRLCAKPAALRATGHGRSPARGLIPPALLGAMQDRPRYRSSPEGQLTRDPLRWAVNASLLGEHQAFLDQLRAALEGLAEQIEEDAAQDEVAEAQADLAVWRLSALYPDCDAIISRFLEGPAPWGCSDEQLSLLRSVAEEALQEHDPELRRACYLEFEDYLATHALFVPLFFEQSCHFCQPSIEGLRLRLASPEVAYEELQIISKKLG
ncbi:MAG: ABC transporter substrate-binding protein [Acidobacteriota bacterium]